MKAEGKVPNDAIDRQAIDIFVFTNGQGYSPPRKYHLNVQELNLWKAILSFLARSQFGSIHSSIDLYTVVGEKLEGPSQLSNGAAYVAVKPPDRFIDTGYSKYLLKASRSWEKSQARRPNSIEIIKPEECNVVTAVSNTSVSDKKIKEEIVACEMLNNIVVKDPKIEDRPKALAHVQENCNAVCKQADKRRISPIQRSSILRKSATTPTNTKKDSEKAKDMPKYSKWPLKVNDKARVVNDRGVRNSKTPQKTETNNSEVKPEEVNLEKIEAPLLAYYSNNYIQTTEKALHEAECEKNDLPLQSHIIKSADSEIPSAVVPNLVNNIADNIDNILNKINQEFNGNKTKDTTDIANIKQKAGILEFAIGSPNSEKCVDNEKMLSLYQMHRAPNVSFAEGPDKNCVVINNGDIVNLKLQIEVCNVAGILKKTVKTEQKTHSLTQIFKKEMGSQINLDNDIAIHNKSLQSIFISNFAENGARGNSGAIAIKCACSPENNYNISKINAEPTNNSKVYVILLPTPVLSKKIERCQCGNDTMNNNETDISETNRASIINPVKKAMSTIALDRLTSTTDVTKTTKLSFTDSEKSTFVPNVTECPKIESQTKHHVAIIENDNFSPKDNPKNHSKIKCIDDVDSGVIANNTKILAKRSEFRATQTEMCSLLLEARRHEDGRYSFYLPPLNILKCYKL